jgi:anaerobic magnesium-protoporphyrin IX monomethyl ester cyclase
LPFPARELDLKVYFNPKLNFKKFTNVLASRGCANRCYFCVPNSISWSRELEWKRYNSGKPPVTVRSAKNVLEEIQMLKNQGYEEFSFIDDQFSVGKERVLEILEGLSELKMDFGLLARADRINDQKIVQTLAKAGCKYIDLGVESFDQEILDDIHKDLKVETVKKTIYLLTKYGIEPKLNIMLGTSPKETKEIIKKTIDEAINTEANYCMFSIATPFPGTEFAKKAEENRWILKDQPLNPASRAQINYPHLGKEDLEKLVREANRRFYLRPKIIFAQFRKIKSWESFINSGRTLTNLIKNIFYN